MVKYSLYVIGAGGTGTYFLKEFARFVADKKEMFHSMTIFDGDIVEQKNLKRQCFMEEDIGRNKAAVMAEILNDSFGLSFVSKDCFLNSTSQLKENSYGNAKVVPLIVSCVDNHGCRMILEKFFEKEEDCIYFDSANEFDNGEVVFSYKANGKVCGPTRSYYFPQIKLGDVRNREEISCEELNNVAPQHIFTNMQAGHLLCCGVANLLDGKLTPGIAFFNSLKYECTFKAWRGSAGD